MYDKLYEEIKDKLLPELKGEAWLVIHRSSRPLEKIKVEVNRLVSFSIHIRETRIPYFLHLNDAINLVKALKNKEIAKDTLVDKDLREILKNAYNDNIISVNTRERKACIRITIACFWDQIIKNLKKLITDGFPSKTVDLDAVYSLLSISLPKDEANIANPETDNNNNVDNAQLRNFQSKDPLEMQTFLPLNHFQDGYLSQTNLTYQEPENNVRNDQFQNFQSQDPEMQTFFNNFNPFQPDYWDPAHDL